jgi:hypothetical protein
MRVLKRGGMGGGVGYALMDISSISYTNAWLQHGQQADVRASWQAPLRRPGATPCPRAGAMKGTRARMGERAPPALPAHTRMCQDQDRAVAAPRVSHVC